MRSPYIGRGIALVVIAGLVAWTAFRALGSRPPETPKMPFPAPAVDAPLATAKSRQTAVLAGGCFWGLQAVFAHLKGVSSVTSGYAGGYVKSPSYESVNMGVTGHAETVSIIYDPSRLTYGQLLMVFFSVAHDPTQWNRQVRTPAPRTAPRSSTPSRSRSASLRPTSHSSMLQRSTPGPSSRKSSPSRLSTLLRATIRISSRTIPAIPTLCTMTCPSWKI